MPAVINMCAAVPGMFVMWLVSCMVHLSMINRIVVDVPSMDRLIHCLVLGVFVPAYLMLAFSVMGSMSTWMNMIVIAYAMIVFSWLLSLFLLMSVLVLLV
jgi:hypothetical protein